MANNTITISFEPCEPAPANGYRVTYRPIGGGDYRTYPSNFISSPAVIVDDQDPIGTSYEGFIEGDCGDGKFGLPVRWQAVNEEAPSQSGSGSESASALSNPFKLGSMTEVLCASIPVNLFWEGPGAALVPGNTMYTDSMLTTPVTGFSLIADSVGTEIFNLNSGTGVVGSTTGSGC